MTDDKSTWYTVGFTKPFGEMSIEMHWRSYKTFGGARRFIEEKWRYSHFREAHKVDGWFIMRCAQQDSNVRGVILAMSKDCRVQNYYKTRG